VTGTHGGKRAGAGRKPRTDGRQRGLVRVNLTAEEHRALVENTDPDERRKRIMDTEDRVQQVNWIRQYASDLVDSQPPECTAEEIVEYALNDVDRDPRDELPSWFDTHDRSLLLRFVKEEMAR